MRPLRAGLEHQRIAAPMVGGMLSAPLLSMLVVPAAYRMLQRWRLRRARPDSVGRRGFRVV